MDTLILLWKIFVFLLIKTTGGKEVKYEGCMKRTVGGSDFRTQIKIYRKAYISILHIRFCIEECWEKRQKYAGLHNSHYCYCSVATKDMVTVPESNCDRRCAKNCQQVCGGKHTLSVYSTGYSREPSFVMDKKSLTQGLIGCYRSNGASGNVLCPKNTKPLNTKRMTVPLCVYYCDAMYQSQFATLAGSAQCCCSNSVHGAQQTDLSLCKLPCDGDPSVHCYGFLRGVKLWTTYQKSRLPAFRRWPKTTFLETDWLAVPLTKDQTFEISKLSKSVAIGAADATLSGLLAKKKARKLAKGEKDEDGEEEAEEEAAMEGAMESMVGDDKRQPVEGGVENSASVLDVPASKVVTPVVEEKSDTTGAFIGTLVVVFAVMVAAFTCYMFSRKKKRDAELEDELEAAREKRREKRAERRRRRKEEEENEEEEEEEDEERGEETETEGETDEEMKDRMEGEEEEEEEEEEDDYNDERELLR